MYQRAISTEDALGVLPYSAQMQIHRKPICKTVNMGSHTRVEFYCPLCGGFVISYKAGPSWCENGLYSVERHDCKCGQKLDWRGIPYANRK